MEEKKIANLLSKIALYEQPAPGFSPAEAIKLLTHQVTFTLMPHSPSCLLIWYHTGMPYDESADSRGFEHFWSLWHGWLLANEVAVGQDLASQVAGIESASCRSCRHRWHRWLGPVWSCVSLCMHLHSGVHLRFGCISVEWDRLSALLTNPSVDF